MPAIAPVAPKGHKGAPTGIDQHVAYLAQVCRFAGGITSYGQAMLDACFMLQSTSSCRLQMCILLDTLWFRELHRSNRCVR